MTETNINKPNHLSSASTASNFVKIFFKYTVLEEMWKFKDNIKKRKEGYEKQPKRSVQILSPVGFWLPWKLLDSYNQVFK